MRLPRRLFCTALLGLAAGFASLSASAADPKARREYLTLPRAAD
jgi:thiol:disulfide interchange protein DsbA